MKRIAVILLVIVFTAGMMLVTACESGITGSEKENQSSTESEKVKEYFRCYKCSEPDRFGPCELEIQRSLAGLGLDMLLETSADKKSKSVLISPETHLRILARLKLGAE